MFFGEKLKEIRLKYGKMGLRNFCNLSNSINLSPSKLSEIEHGYIDPVIFKSDKFRIGIFNKLLSKVSKEEKKNFYQEWRNLIELLDQPFEMKYMPENIILSPFTSKTNGRKLNKEELKNLTQYINDIAQEHNEKAKKYNKRIKNE